MPTYGAPGTIKDRIMAGEPLDVLVFPAPNLDDLVKQGKIVADSKVILARSGMGVAVRAGAPKPDISTPGLPPSRSSTPTPHYARQAAFTSPTCWSV